MAETYIIGRDIPRNMLEIGIKGKSERKVTPEMTAKAVGSGALEVLATPVLISMAEAAASDSVAPFLDDGESTVGARMEFEHTAPSPVGAVAICETELVGIDGRSLTFSITASDAAGPIGRGTHVRVRVDSTRFMTKAGSRLRSR